MAKDEYFALCMLHKGRKIDGKNNMQKVDVDNETKMIDIEIMKYKKSTTTTEMRKHRH